MGKRDENREEVFNSILNAAEYEFGLHGFKGASLNMIADRAKLPKANIIYYFTSKENLYKEVLNTIIFDWNNVFDKATADDDPAVVLDQFIRTKLQQSMNKPKSSRIFAMEVIQGASHIKDYLSTELSEWFKERTAVIDTWIAAGKMKAVDPSTLIFMIWATTQHYADFEAQVLVLKQKTKYSEEDLQSIGDTVSGIILRGCGLELPSA